MTMSLLRLVFCEDGRSVYRKAEQAPLRKRADLPSPMFIRDEMEPTEHVDGRLYTSKSAFRRVTRENGLTEVGNDPARKRRVNRQKTKRSDIKEAVEKADYIIRNGIPPQTR